VKRRRGSDIATTTHAIPLFGYFKNAVNGINLNAVVVYKQVQLSCPPYWVNWGRGCQNPLPPLPSPAVKIYLNIPIFKP